MTENDYLEGFDRFWAMYPRKVSKGSAKKTWLKLVKGYEKEDFDQFTTKIIRAVDSQVRRKKRDGDESLTYWKHPATWLNGECWLDDVGDISEKPKQHLSKCLYCDREVHGPSFNRCQYHLGVDEKGRLTHSFADEMRDYARRHPEVLKLKGKEAVEWIKDKLSRMVISG